MARTEAGGLTGQKPDGGGLAMGVGLAAFLGKLGDTWNGLDGPGQERVLQGMLQFFANPISSPTVKKLIGSKTGASLTYTFIDLGTPPGGKIWDVRRVAVWGTATDSFTAPASVIAEIGVFPAVPADGASAPAIEHLVTVATTANLPNTASWLRGQLTLVASEHLVVILKSIGTLNIACSGQAIEWDESQRSSWASP